MRTILGKSLLLLAFAGVAATAQEAGGEVTQEGRCLRKIWRRHGTR
jgi:hypothetical protein